jgi:hypothetical protein
MNGDAPSLLVSMFAQKQGHDENQYKINLKRE